jgi:hypothetical protein
MPPQTQLPRVVRFGTFEVDVPAGELRKNGLKVKLQRSRSKSCACWWSGLGRWSHEKNFGAGPGQGTAMAISTHGLNAAVKRLRDALGDDPDNPRFVETLESVPSELPA